MDPKPKLTKFQSFVSIAFFVCMAVLFFWHFHWQTIDITLADQKLHVLVAKTMSQQIRGLGRRDSLGEYDGMLFYFPIPRRAGIVMRDMRFPIDILWIRDGVVIDLYKNAPLEPGKSETELTAYYPRKEANYVLELTAGWSDAHHVVLGDRVGVVGKQ